MTSYEIIAGWGAPKTLFKPEDGHGTINLGGIIIHSHFKLV